MNSCIKNEASPVSFLSGTIIRHALLQLLNDTYWSKVMAGVDVDSRAVDVRERERLIA